MDIGRDVLTQTLLGSTEAEKVFTPWWITVHHYLVYTIVILVSEKKPKLTETGENARLQKSAYFHADTVTVFCLFSNTFCKKLPIFTFVSFPAKASF